MNALSRDLKLNFRFKVFSEGRGPNYPCVFG